MKRTITYSSAVIATLLIGFVIGFLVNGRVTKYKIRKMRTEYTDKGFNRAFMRTLHPTPEQMEQLEPILQKYAGKHRELMESMREDQEEIFNDFRLDVMPYLTEEQIRRLDRMHQKRKKRMDRSPHPGKGKNRHTSRNQGGRKG